MIPTRTNNTEAEAETEADTETEYLKGAFSKVNALCV